MLEDPLSGELFQHGGRASVARLVRFLLPQEWVGPEAEPTPADPDLLGTLQLGDTIVVETRTLQYTRACSQSRTDFRRGRHGRGCALHIPVGSRFGPWQRQLGMLLG